MKKYFYILLVLFIVINCKSGDTLSKEENAATDAVPAKVTFIELGSDNCIPCKAMQPILKAVETGYGNQVQVLFYDVWKDDTMAKKYGISVIPTQIFLDSNAVEFHRHEGFYPLAKIDSLFAAKGLVKTAPND